MASPLAEAVDAAALARAAAEAAAVSKHAAALLSAPPAGSSDRPPRQRRRPCTDPAELENLEEEREDPPAPPPETPPPEAPAPAKRTRAKRTPTNAGAGVGAGAVALPDNLSQAAEEFARVYREANEANSNAARDVTIKLRAITEILEDGGKKPHKTADTEARDLVESLLNDVSRSQLSDMTRWGEVVLIASEEAGFPVTIPSGNFAKAVRNAPPPPGSGLKPVSRIDEEGIRVRVRAYLLPLVTPSSPIPPSPEIFRKYIRSLEAEYEKTSAELEATVAKLDKDMRRHVADATSAEKRIAIARAANVATNTQRDELLARIAQLDSEYKRREKTISSEEARRAAARDALHAQRTKREEVVNTLAKREPLRNIPKAPDVPPALLAGSKRSASAALDAPPALEPSTKKARPAPEGPASAPEGPTPDDDDLFGPEEPASASNGKEEDVSDASDSGDSGDNSSDSDYAASDES